MMNFLELLYNRKQMVLMYAATAMKPRLKDAMLDTYFPAQTATTMLKTVTAAQMQKNQQVAYPADPQPARSITGRCFSGLWTTSHGYRSMTLSMSSWTTVCYQEPILLSTGSI